MANFLIPRLAMEFFVSFDVLTVKIEHNGKTETHRINVYTETRGCAYNQQ